MGVTHANWETARETCLQRFVGGNSRGPSFATRSHATSPWIHETDYELVKLEAEATDAVPIALGLLARVSKGSRLEFQRRKVNGEVWLPARASYMGSARVALVKTIRRGGSSEYSNYKKFTVGTTTTFEGPANSGQQR